MNPLIAKLLLDVGSSAIMELINVGADVLKGRDDNTMYKDADKIKDLVANNETNCKEVEQLDLGEKLGSLANGLVDGALDDYIGDKAADAVGDLAGEAVEALTNKITK